MDYYNELGVDKNASDVDIKQAYRRLAKTYHPDRNKSPNAEEKIKRVNEAYGVLGDKSKRASYDNKQNKVFDGFGNQSFDIKDVFSGTNFGSNKRTKKHNIKKTFDKKAKTTIKVDFKDTITGTEKKINHTYKSECPSCTGFGGEVNSCSICGGNGMVNKNDGFISINMTCSSCKGTGKKIKSECGVCDSTGYETKTEILSVKIPEGLEKRTQLFVKGKGNYINKSRGDLYIDVDVISDKHFTRKGNDLILTFGVDVLDILMESEITIDGIKDKITIKLNPDNIKEDIIKSGQGTKTVNSENYGDLIIKLTPEFKKLTEKQKNIIKTMG